MEKSCKTCASACIHRIGICDDWKQPNKPIEPKQDLINSPNHYTAGGIETIDFIQVKLSPEQFEGYCLGNVLKYVSRHKHKGGVEDLKKARWYIDKLIESI